MADSETTVNVTPNTSITLQAPAVNNAGSEAIAVALVKSSENQAAATASLINALVPQGEATMPGTKTPNDSNAMNLLLLGLIALLLWK